MGKSELYLEKIIKLLSKISSKEKKSIDRAAKMIAARME